MFSIMLKPKVLLTITVAIAIVGSAWLLSRGIRYFRHGDPIITVTGKAERNIKSDLTYWKISLTTKENERLKAYEVLQESHNKVISFLKEKGITENEITVSNSSVKHYDGYNDEYYSNRKTPIKYYIASINIIVKSERVDEIENVYQKIQTLFIPKIDLDIHSPKYYYTNMNVLKMDLLKEASSDAYKRASIIAEGSNSRIKNLSSSTMGVFQIIGANTDEEYSWYGSLNTESKMKIASVTVRSSYKIK